MIKEIRCRCGSNVKQLMATSPQPHLSQLVFMQSAEHAGALANIRPRALHLERQLRRVAIRGCTLEDSAHPLVFRSLPRVVARLKRTHSRVAATLLPVAPVCVCQCSWDLQSIMSALGRRVSHL